MKIEVEIVSRENIKPSCPTPPHLRIFKLSLLDQLIPSPYAPIILFYSANDNISVHYDQNHIPKRLYSLKKSLSDTLTRFYPLAGKIKDDLSIDCDDEGAYYVEARVDTSLRQFLSQPDLLLVNKLLPCELGSTGLNLSGTYVANIQVNVFDCCGIAIGLCISHKILDGVALSTFLQSWAAAAQCCEEEPVRPNFEASSLFPANDLWLRDASMAMFGSLFRKGNSVTKRFVFGSSAISTLKDESTSPSLKNPTRVEAVSGFLWRCFVAASKEKNGVLRPSLLTHLVNLRRRTTPFLPENTIGNLLWIAAAKTEGNGELVTLVRDSMSKFDGEFVKNMRGDKGKCMMLECLKEIDELGSKEGVDYIGFSSWCKLGFYEVDFGWGKPIWVSSIGSSGSVIMNLVILVDTRLGDGIEAWVTLDQDDMAIMECKTQLLKLAQVDPSPLSSCS